MPEATVYKHHLTPGWENQVRPARQVGPVQAITIPKTMKQPPHLQLRFHALGLNLSHYLTADFWRNGIHDKGCSLQKCHPFVRITEIVKNLFRVKNAGLLDSERPSRTAHLTKDGELRAMWLPGERMGVVVFGAALEVIPRVKPPFVVSRVELHGRLFEYFELKTLHIA